MTCVLEPLLVVLVIAAVSICVFYGGLAAEGKRRDKHRRMEGHD